MNIRFYFDPVCPWCWQTSRWLVSIRDSKDITIDWRSISLAVKNGTMPKPYQAQAEKTHDILRIVEFIRQDESLADPIQAVDKFYTALGELIHRQKLIDELEAAEIAEKALAIADLPADLISAMQEDKWDQAIKDSTQEAVSLAGDDVGTPIIAIPNQEGSWQALFGPVISRVPTDREEALKLWDAYQTLASYPYFWEIKRSRTEDPQIT